MGGVVIVVRWLWGPLVALVATVRVRLSQGLLAFTFETRELAECRSNRLCTKQEEQDRGAVQTRTHRPAGEQQHWYPNQYGSGEAPLCDGHSAVRLNRNAFPITDTELNVIAALAQIGLMRIPAKGYSSPAATGTPSAL